MAVKYLSNKVKDLQVGITNYSENKSRSLYVVGNVGIGTANPTDEVGISNTSVLAVGILTAYRIFSSVYGEFQGGSVSADNIVGVALSVSGITTLSTVKISGGIVTATTGVVTYYGDGTKLTGVGGIGSLDQLTVSGLSTFTGLIRSDGGAYLAGITTALNFTASTAKVTDLTDNRVVIAGSNGELEDDANLTYDGTVLSVGTGLTVTGVSTFAGAIDANGDLDVDGHTELDDVNVSGISTFDEDVVFKGQHTNARWEKSTSNLTLYDDTRLELGSNTDFEMWHGGTHTFMKNSGGDLRIRGDKILLKRADDSERYLEANVNNEVKLFFNGVEKIATTLDGVDITGHVETDTINVSGLSTFAGAIDANGDLDVDGHTELDDVNVSGISTFNNNATFDRFILVPDGTQDGSSGGSIRIGDSQDMQIFHYGGNGQIRNDTGMLKIRGSSTNSSSIRFDNTVGEVYANFAANGPVDLYHDNSKKFSTTGYGITVYGTTETQTLNVTGLSTFTGAIDANGDLDVDGHTELDNVNVTGVTTFNQDVQFPGAAYNILWDQATSKFKFDDNAQLVFGSASGGDMKLFHQSGNSTIRNETGQFRIAGNDIRLQTQNHSEDYLLAVDGGSVSIFHNDVKRLETTASGVDITDNLNVAGISTLGTVKVSGGIVTATAGVVTYYGDGQYLTGIDVENPSQLNVTGVSTFSGNIDANGDLDVDGETNLDDLRVSGVATLTTVDINAGAIDGTTIGASSAAEGTFSALTVTGQTNLNGNVALGNASTDTIQPIGRYNASIIPLTDNDIDLGADGLEFKDLYVDGIANIDELVADTVKISDLTDNRIVIAGTAGELEDTTKLTFDGTTLSVDGDATFTGNVSIAGTLTKEDVTNIDSVGLVTARSGVRVTAGGLIVSSGVATFTDAIDANSGLDVSGGTGLTASSAKISDLTVNRVVTVGASGELQDSANLGYDGTKLTTNGLTVNGNILAPNAGNFVAIGTADALGSGTDRLALLGSSTDSGVRIWASSATHKATSVPLQVADYSGTELFRVHGDGNVGIGSAIPSSKLDVSGNITGAGDLTLTDTTADSAAGPEFKLYRNSSSPADADYLGQIKFAGESDTGVERNYAKITGKILDASNGTEDGIIEFAHIKAGSQTITGRFRSDSLQLLNDTALSVAGDITANGNIAGDTATNISGINSVTATTYYGDGSTLAGVAKTTILEDSGISTSGTSTFNHLSVTGVSTFTGTFANLYVDQVRLGQAASDNISAIGRFDTNLVASGNNIRDLGTSSVKWKDLYLSGTANFDGDINANGNIVGDDSTNISGISSVTATTYYGSGANLTGINAGFDPDSQENLYAGTDAGKCSTSDNCYNVAIGYHAGCQIGDGGNAQADNNVFIGKCSGALNDDGTQNTFLGSYSGELNCSGHHNSAVGYQALGVLTVGNCNAAIGYNAGSGNTSGYRNTFLGAASGTSVSNGCNNVVIGQSAQVVSGTGNFQLAIGSGANNWIDGDANFNVGIGTNRHDTIVGAGVTAKLSVGIVSAYQLYGHLQDDVNYNVFAGTDAGKCAGSSNSYNVAIGYKAGCKTGTSSSQGYNNVLIGKCAGASNTSGQNNTFLGPYAGCAGSSGRENVSIGYYAMPYLNGGNYNTAIGKGAGCKNDGNCNTFVGNWSGKNMTTAKCSVALGLDFEFPSATEDNQLLIASKSIHWIYGNGDGNIGIGTDYPNAAVTSANTKKLSVGIVSAYQLYGDGSALTGIDAGFTQDAQGNLVAGTGAGAARDADTCFNIMIGCNAGAALNEGDANIVMGCNAGCSLTSSYENVILGCEAGSSATTGAQNIMIGSYAGTSNETGWGNVFIGNRAGKNVATDSADNVFVGQYTGNCVRGGCNTGMGKRAIWKMCSGSFNVAYGVCALHGSATHSNNTGGCNVAMGKDAGKCVSSGADNIALGRSAMSAGVVTGSYNVVFGKEAGLNATSAGCNIILGLKAGKSITAAGNNIFMGCYAGANLDGASVSTNIMIGEHAGKGTAGCSGISNNIFIGRYTGTNIQTASYNVAVGRQAGKCLTTQSRNAFFGNYAGCAVQSGCNTFLGHSAGRGGSDITGGKNIAIGYCANIPDITGSNQLAIGIESNNWIVGNANFNVGIGTTNPDTAVGVGNTAKLSVGIVSAYMLYGCGANLTGIDAGWEPDAQGNLYAGTDAGAASDADTTCNIAIGQGAGKSLNAGDYNVLVGYCAGEAATQASKLVAIGYKAAQCSQVYPTSFSNVFMGAEAGRKFCRGQGNVAIGHEALFGGLTHQEEVDYSIFIGQYAGKSVCRGADAIWMGCKVGAGVTDAGTGNIWLGNQAGGGAGTDVGNNNVFIGASAGKDITTGNLNNFIGAFAGTNIESGSYNVGYGRGAGQLLTTGSSNTFLGRYAGCMITTGSSNVVIGKCAGCNKLDATTGEQIAIGAGDRVHLWGECKSFGVIETTIAGIATVYSATGIVSATKFCGDGSALTGISAGGFSADADLNLMATNTCSGCNLDGADGCFNILLGACAGKDVTSGHNNVSLGCGAGCKITTGCDNIMMGKLAGYYVTSGNRNVIMGSQAGGSLGDHDYNVMIGPEAGSGVSGDNNVMIGRSAGSNRSGGSDNVFLGRYAGTGQSGTITGGHNVGIGYITLGGVGNHEYNIAVGFRAGKAMTSGTYNIISGYEAACSITTGYENIVVGHCAAADATTAQWNVIVGCSAGKAITCACHNVMIGRNVGLGNTGGSQSIIIGMGAGKTGVAICNNILIGNEAGHAGTLTGTKNVMLGNQTGCQLTSGEYNTLLGHCAGTNLTTASDSVMIGRGAGQTGTTTGNENIFIGKYAGKSAASAPNNVAIGKETGCSLDSGAYNVFVGDSVGRSHTTGSQNIMSGYYAGNSQTSASCNLKLGWNAGRKGNGDDNVILGTGAGCETTANCGVLIGAYAGRCMCNGNYNIAVGNNALLGSSTVSDNTGYCNIAIGYDAGKVITTGWCNIILGTRAGKVLATGYDNVLIGAEAGGALTGGSSAGFFNVMIGAGAGKGTVDGYGNVILGRCAGELGDFGDYNFFGGYGSGKNTTGGYNTFVGACAGDNHTGSGGYNVAIGYQVELPSATGGTQLVIGHNTNKWITGDSSYNITVNDISAANFNSTSDIRLKTNIKRIEDPIGKVNRIEGVTFDWKEYNRPALGVIADQVEEVIPELVQGTDPKTVNYNGLIGLLIEAVKEQQTQIDDLKSRLSKLE